MQPLPVIDRPAWLRHISSTRRVLIRVSTPAAHAFRNKPGGVVAYSAGRVGGARAVEHLALMAVEAEMVPMRNTVLIPTVHDAFTGGGDPTDPGTAKAVDVLLDDLAWWAALLRYGRDRGSLPPAGVRGGRSSSARAAS